MKHKKIGTHLGRTTSHKKALIRNMISSLIEHKAIKTTNAKAKEAKRFAERLITYAKKGSLHHRRLAFRFLQNKQAVKTLFDEIGPACAERPGGYTRIIKLGFRKGDAAAISMLELVDFSGITGEKIKAKKAAKAEKKEKEVAKEAASKETKETAKEVTE
jgi:large subunit ribosomal protein L17